MWYYYRVYYERGSMIPTIILIYILAMPSFTNTGHTSTFSNTPYTICFTPQEQCTDLVVHNINKAQRDIYVQVFSFSSEPIYQALIDAKRRGVNVTILVDDITKKNKYILSLKGIGINVFLDSKPRAAHNKVIIIDGHITITGSFNWSRAAQYDNAENMLVIDDEELYSYYKLNILYRLQQSTLLRNV